MPVGLVKIPKKTLDVQITTMDAVLEFQIEEKSTGKQLFELVSMSIGVREVWYFGLRYKDDKGLTAWLKYDKRIVDQNIPKERILEFHFRAKFFPEDVGDELVQEVTQHLFYLQVKDGILCEDIYCPPELSVMLASYAIQTKCGDFDPENHKPGFLADKKLLPQKVMDQCHVTQGMWEERITSWCSQHKGMLREEAELEYLKVAQDLEMYGVSYFEAKNKKGTEVWIGIDASGANVYEREDQLSPSISFPWPEIRRVGYNGKKVYITPTDKSAPNFIFYVSKTRTSDLIMELCIGNNELYHRRRRVDTLEVQQMKAQAKEEKARKMAERERLEKEIEARKEAERKKAELEERIKELEGKAKEGNETKEQTDRTVEVLEEKVEEKAQAHAQKNLQLEEEIRASAVKSEDDQMAMDRISQLIEERAGSVIHSSQKKEMEAQELRRQLEETRIAVKSAKMKLIEATGGPQSPPTTAAVTPSSASVDVFTARSLSPEWESSPHGEVELNHDGDFEQLSKQLKKDSMDYQQKYKYISEQLDVLKTEMDDLKREDKVTRNDLIHEKNIRLLEKLTLLLSDIN